MAAGVVKLALQQGDPADVQAKLTQLEADIASGKVHPYAGEIKDQDGTVRVPSGSVLSDKDIRATNWLLPA